MKDLTEKQGKFYRGFTYDEREYIVYIEDTYPSVVVVQFPNEKRPIRVDYHSKGACSSAEGNCERGTFMIPAESHPDYKRGYSLYRVNSRLCLTDNGYGDIAFLNETEGFRWIIDNYIDLPDDIYSKPTFVDFWEFYIVKLHRKYHRDRDSFEPIIMFWYKHDNSVALAHVTYHATYRDGGTFIADMDLNSMDYHLVIPTPCKENAMATLNDDVDKGVIYRNKENSGDDYWKLWRRFKEASGLKLYHTTSSRDCKHFDL